MFGHDRRHIREHFLSVWRKMESRAPLEPLAAIIAGVLEDHPEYHGLFKDGDALLDADWTPEGGETNPFLHMGLHIAVREQVGADRPVGMRSCFEQLAMRAGDALAAEHIIIECLAEALWNSGRSGLPPDDTAYLDCIRKQARITR